MNVRDATATFRSPDRADYPELAGYSREEIYQDTFGGGALYLAAKMTRTMRLNKGDIVLDLGCGKGATSVFLIKHFGVKVIALDLWTSATFLNDKFSRLGYRHEITPFQMDITKELPFAEGYFDAIFCMNSFSFYGGNVDFLRHILRHLKHGGQICIGGEILSEEFTPEGFKNPPAVYNYYLPPPNENVNVWEGDFSKMHSPPWWESLFKRSGLVEVLDCRELEDATILYEDLVLFQVEHNLDPEDVEISIAQLEFGRTQRPYKTLFTLTARKL
jgi:SAM-dependent methyltransferase